HTATLLPNGKVLVAGGYTGGVGGGSTLSISELFDPASGAWTRTVSLAVARFSHTATLLPDGGVLVAGGAVEVGHLPPGVQYATLGWVERFDRDPATWSAASSLNTARALHTATLLADGSVLAAGGGVTEHDYSTTLLDSAELYTAAPSADPSLRRAIEYRN